MRTRPFLLVLTPLLTAADPASTRPVDPSASAPAVELHVPAEPSRSSGLASFTGLADFDTVYYGGTRWAPDSLRWEALRDSVWTFETGVGSSINTGANPNKPVGYHQTLEGWFGIDQNLSSLSSSPLFPPKQRQRHQWVAFVLGRHHDLGDQRAVLAPSGRPGWLRTGPGRLRKRLVPDP